MEGRNDTDYRIPARARRVVNVCEAIAVRLENQLDRGPCIHAYRQKHEHAPMRNNAHERARREREREREREDI